MNWLRVHYHRLLATFWVTMLVPTVLWWKEAVVWVAIMSIYANVESSMAADAANKTDADMAAKLDAILEAFGIDVEDDGGVN